jgi:type IV pilus biogenesis protein CpaD/CtpE
MKSLILVAVAIALVGCASADSTGTVQDSPPELVYRTGSNIPVRSATPLTPEEKAAQADASKRLLESAQRSLPQTSK